jgi:hypothetical protein
VGQGRLDNPRTHESRTNLEGRHWLYEWTSWGLESPVAHIGQRSEHSILTKVSRGGRDSRPGNAEVAVPRRGGIYLASMVHDIANSQGSLWRDTYTV